MASGSSTPDHKNINEYTARIAPPDHKAQNMTVTKKHINLVKVGDLILCKDGEVRTLNAEYLHLNTFCGTTIWGDSYRLGTQPVQVVTNLN